MCIIFGLYCIFRYFYVQTIISLLYGAPKIKALIYVPKATACLIYGFILVVLTDVEAILRRKRHSVKMSAWFFGVGKDWVLFIVNRLTGLTCGDVGLWVFFTLITRLGISVVTFLFLHIYNSYLIILKKSKQYGKLHLICSVPGIYV